eukprot:gene1662-1851_t
MESLYPNNLELIEEKGLSVQGQGNYALRTAIDQHREQTINRDAKVVGGIKSFSGDESSILKWTVNRAQQADNTASLRSFSNIDAQCEIRKQLRPSSILSSEKKVQSMLRVLTSEYINPFDPGLDKDKLYNLSCGTPVNFELANEILNVLPNGKTAHCQFVNSRLESTNIKFHEPIKRQKRLLFSNCGKNTEIKVNGMSKVVEANRDVLVDIVADCYTPYSIKSMERNRRGMAPKIIVQSPKSKVPHDFKISLANGENKTRMIELIRDVLVANMEAVLSTLRSESVVFSSFQDCIMVSPETVHQIPDLHTSQEEADTKAVLHANHVVTGNEEGAAVIRSHSGDIDIVWRSSLVPESQLGDSVDNGWTEELEPKWFERMMPDDIEDLFVDMEYEEFSKESEESAGEDDDE